MSVFTLEKWTDVLEKLKGVLSHALTDALQAWGNAFTDGLLMLPSSLVHRLASFVYRELSVRTFAYNLAKYSILMY